MSIMLKQISSATSLTALASIRAKFEADWQNYLITGMSYDQYMALFEAYVTKFNSLA